MDDSSDLAESDSKQARQESPDSPLAAPDDSPAEGLPERKRRRVEESTDFVDSPKAKRIQDDLLNILDDSDGGSDRDPAVPDLDSVIKSFEEEISVPAQQRTSPDLDLTPDAALNELGYLLEASDDELGLPPSFGSSVDENSNHEIQECISSSAFSMPFDGEMPNYDGFDLGPDISNNVSGKEVGGNEEFVMLGGLFDFTDNYGVLAGGLIEVGGGMLCRLPGGFVAGDGNVLKRGKP